MQHHSHLEVKDGVGGHLLVVPRKKFFSFRTVHAVWIIIFSGGNGPTYEKLHSLLKAWGNQFLCSSVRLNVAGDFSSGMAEKLRLPLKMRSPLSKYKILAPTVNGLSTARPCS